MLSVEVSDVRPDFGKKFEKAYRQYLKDSGTVGYNTSLENAPEDRGQLSQTSVPPEWRGDVLVWGYTQPYAEAQEKGTRPFTPPLRPLKEWAGRVLGDEGLGYAVQQKIAREGIQPKHFVRDGKDRQEQWLSSHGIDRYMDR